MIVNDLVADLAATDGATPKNQDAVRGSTIGGLGDDSTRSRWLPRQIHETCLAAVTPRFLHAREHLSALPGRAIPYCQNIGSELFAGAGRTASIIPMIVKLCSSPGPRSSATQRHRRDVTPGDYPNRTRASSANASSMLSGTCVAPSPIGSSLSEDKDTEANERSVWPFL